MTLEQTISAIRPLDEKKHDGGAKSFCKYCHAARWTGSSAGRDCAACGYSRSASAGYFQTRGGCFLRGQRRGRRGRDAVRAGGDSHGRGKYGRGESTVCLMAKQLGMDVFPVDIGVARPIKSEKVLQFVVRRGTANFAHEPAMTRKEALETVEIGIKMAEMCAERDIRCSLAAKWASATRLRARQSRRRSPARRLRRSQDAGGSVNGRAGAKNRSDRGGAGASQTRLE